ncbi:MAG: glutamate--tRNA ligase [Chloroflexi bacterium]|nr:glutamate--tRNA ligase [Chloroflexota bacterium]
MAGSPVAGSSMTPRVRIAPSPTGPLHIGTARTALFNYLYARHHGGTFMLRVEDTDQARSTLAYERDILDGLHWLGLSWDEGPEVAGRPAVGPYAPYRQSERTQLYREAADRLLQQDRAYACYCSREQLEADKRAQEAAHQPPHYVGRCASLTPEQRRLNEAQGIASAVRFRVGRELVAFDDLIRGRVEIDTTALGGDLVILRSDGTPLYHFTVAVDDATMAITHVIRGEDHLSNTPKHILLFRALGADVPQFAHLPLILNADRTKMSKRKSQTAVSDYVAQGFVREGFVNYLALLGWASGTEEELFSLDELVERFEIERVHSGGAVFDRERLEWLNGQWIRRLGPDDLAERLAGFLAAELDAREAAGARIRRPAQDEIRTLVPLVQERLPVLGAIGDLVDFLFLGEIAVTPEMLVPKRWDERTTLEALKAARATIADVPPVTFEADELEPPLRALADERGWKAGDLFMAIRVAITGRTATPPLFDTLVALGRDRTLQRLEDGIRLLETEKATVTGG